MRALSESWRALQVRTGARRVEAPGEKPSFPINVYNTKAMALRPCGRINCDEAEVFEAWIPKRGREVDATKPAWRFVPGLMRTKFEASSWIPKLGCDVQVTKPKWRFDAIEDRS